ncbi:MAG TPA: tripartite tricarboxylate transporter substrate binding protein [Ramlibacter sp.]|nr:tripartite tricarboxylate transporter substrate binding protein [Ramlibacter sp.]
MNFNSFRVRFFAIAALSWFAAVSPALAQEWPDKPIRLIVPAPPGGIIDTVARALGDQLRTNLGQAVVIDNKPGGSAVVAERALMATPTDGYTLMVGPSSLLSDFPLTVKTPFDPNKTFTYVAAVANMVHILVANPSFPANNVEEVLAQAKKDPKSVSIANVSVGTRSHFLGEMLREKSGGNILSVPYKGSAPAMVDLMGNQVQLSFETVTGSVAQTIKSGKLKGLAVISPTRSQYLPNVPSFGELGLSEFVLNEASIGVFILSSMPKPLTDRIRNEVVKAAHSPKMREMLAAQGLDVPKDASIEELRQKMAATMEQNRKIIDKLKLNLTAASN